LIKWFLLPLLVFNPWVSWGIVVMVALVDLTMVAVRGVTLTPTDRHKTRIWCGKEISLRGWEKFWQ
jgi:hypothetical protein